jgi:phosphoglycolate phosphatase
MAFEGVIFDLDGTLADTLTDIASSMNRILQAHGYPVHPEEDFKLLVGKGLDNLVKQALPADLRLPDVVSACQDEMIEDYEANCLVKTSLYNGIRELLRELTTLGKPFSIFSNKAEPLTLKIVNYLLGDVRFVRVMGARPGFPKKPDPAGALLISDEMGISPENLIYMGDSDVDMITANRAGMFAAGVLWGFRSGEELLANGAATLLNNPGELLELPGWNFRNRAV